MIGTLLQIVGAVLLVVAAFFVSIALGFTVAGSLCVIAGVVEEVTSGHRSTSST